MVYHVDGKGHYFIYVSHGIPLGRVWDHTGEADDRIK